MADLFLDIRDRHIRAIVSDGQETRFQRRYPLKATDTQGEQPADSTFLHEDELSNIIATIRTDSGISIEQLHLILPSAEVVCDTHRLPRMPHEDALKLLTRKNCEKSGDETAQISLTPMAIEQNGQEWFTEYIPVDTLRTYKKTFSATGLKLKTVTTALDSTLHAITHIRESIFNAHAIFEINATTIEAYYVSATNLLLHETLEILDEEEPSSDQESDRSQKRRMFAILDRLYRVNSHYQSAHAMTPLQKVWLCGTDTNIAELSTVLQDALDVETALLAEVDDCAFVALKGFLKAFNSGLVINFMHPDLLRRFPLRKKSGLLIYIATAILTVFFITTAEYHHIKLKKQAVDAKKGLAAQKASKTTSASFIQNLDLLGKLAGNQLMFYPIFRELALNLPDGVYLDAFSYSYKDNHHTIDVSTTFSQSSDLGAQKILTKLMDVMDRSPYLHHHREPSVISNSRELKKTMTVKFTCEVNPLDTAK